MSKPYCAARELSEALDYLRWCGKYVYDKGTPAPKWKSVTDPTPLKFERVFFNVAGDQRRN